MMIAYWFLASTFWEPIIGRLGVIGITVIAVISGLSSVNTPYEHLKIYMRPVLRSDVVSQRNRFLTNMDMVFEKKIQLDRLKTQAPTVKNIET
jgi:hypothetical protein